MFACIQSPELFMETMLCFHGDRDNIGRLSLAASIQDQVSATAMPIVPGSFDHEPSGMDVPCLRDRSSSLVVSG